VPLDGELWLDRKAFQRTVSIVRRQDRSEHWRTISFLVFDAPAIDAGFEQRLDYVREQLAGCAAAHVRLHDHAPCRNVEHLREELARIEALGGEGLMLREPGSRYAAGRSSTLLKVKTFHESDAHVVEHLAGAGRHKGRLGALLVSLPDGTQFSVGTGFSDKQREQPPAVGSLITFRYQELSDRGVPRFPSFVRVRQDVEPTVSMKVAPAKKAQSPAVPISIPATPSVTAATRRFEFVEGSASKFWEVNIAGTDVTVRFGRIGTNGQSQTKTFADTAAAQRHADKLVAEKTGKGYVEQSAG
jgi:DNA ligase-1